MPYFHAVERHDFSALVSAMNSAVLGTHPTAMTQQYKAKILVGEQVCETQVILSDSGGCTIKGVADKKRPELALHQLQYPVFSASMGMFPANCGTAIVHEVNVYAPFTRMGVGRVLMLTVEEIVRKAGFSFMVCTTNQSAPHHERMLVEQDWERGLPFHNSRSGSSCIMWTKYIGKAPRDKTV